MFWKKKNVEQKQIVVELQMLDDVFHRTIIALERLESFLQKERNVCIPPLKQTAIGSSRDLHDDERNYRDKDSYFDELALDCMALFKAAKIEDESVFIPSVEYFLQDIIEWYAGRDGVEYNEVDSCIIPIIVAISRQVRTTRELDEVYEKYVYKTDAQQQSIDNKFNSVQEGMTAWMLASDEAMRPTYNSHHNDSVGFTKHMRGDLLTGYKRIVSYLITKETALPVKIFLRTIKQYLPILAAQLPQVTEENLDKFFSAKLDETTKELQLPKKVTVDSIMPILEEAVKTILDRENISYKTIEITIK